MRQGGRLAPEVVARSARPRGPLVRRAVGLGAQLLLGLLCAAGPGPGGCAGVAIRGSELPAEPIAVRYWTRDEARRRAEALERAAPSRLGVARLEDLGALLGTRAAGAAGTAAPTPEAAADRLWPGHLSLVDPRSGAVTRVGAAPPGAVPMSWSADHGRLLFAADRPTGRWQLYELELASGEVRPRTHGPMQHPSGDYGPEGALAYTELDGTQPERVSVRIDGPGGTRLLVREQAVRSVRWSPRGDMLLLDVMVGRPGGRPARRVRMLRSLSLEEAAEAAADGSDDGSAPSTHGIRALGRGRDPVFDRAGDWIVYSAAVGSGWRLRRLRTGGGSRVAIGAGVRDEIEPAVSPDGRLVAYVAEQDDALRLFVRRIDGSGDRVLVAEGAVRHPVW